MLYEVITLQALGKEAIGALSTNWAVATCITASGTGGVRVINVKELLEEMKASPYELIDILAPHTGTVESYNFV